MILREVKQRQKNLAVGWIDYRKAFDMIPHNWILECLKIFGVNNEIHALLQESMKHWKIDLTCQEENQKRNIPG